jgi:hypothetical protein
LNLIQTRLNAEHISILKPNALHAPARSQVSGHQSRTRYNAFHLDSRRTRIRREATRQLDQVSDRFLSTELIDRRPSNFAFQRNRRPDWWNENRVASL